MKPYLTGRKDYLEKAATGSVTYDVSMLFPVIFLVGIGIVMVYSASSALALKKYGKDYYFLLKQSVFSLMGLFILLGCRHFPIRLFHALTYPLLFLSFVFLIAVKIPGFGINAGGAVRWLSLGIFSFQPAEFARFALIIYMAYSMSKKDYKIRTFAVGFVPHVIVLGIFTALILSQPDFGSVAILFIITWIMMFVGGVRLKYLVISLITLIPVTGFLLFNASYRVKRILSFWNPWEYASEEGYQTIHSLMAFGSGGVWGSGLGKGYQKLFYLPEPHTDFIFSVIGEELGLAGVLLVVICYGLIFWQGLNIARNADSTFSSFLATGLTVSLGLQVCINMGVTLALLPTKGLTLPFLSYGGTSLLMSMASIGVLMNIGANAYHEQTA
ncbi:putative lipid II flippase FtsW [Desulfobacterales bacterium HSG17]|nr:putative lipid II flippase FtsW [Desulfobacterales bacterium HSG17]